MNAEYLLDAIGLLDDGLIREAEEYAVRKRKPGYGSWLGLAACLALVVVLSYGMTHLRMGGAAHDKASGGAASAPEASNGSTAPAAGEPAAPGEHQDGGTDEDMPMGGASNAPEGSQGDYYAAVMVDGTVYWSTGTPVPGEPAEEAIRTVTGYTGAVPEEDGQTNFDRELTTRYAVTDLGLVVLVENEWILFDPVPPWER